MGARAFNGCPRCFIIFIILILLVCAPPHFDRGGSFDSCTLPHVTSSVVDLSQCRISDWDNWRFELKKFVELTVLNMSHNHFKEIDKDLFKAFDKLQRVDLSYNEHLGHAETSGCLIETESITYIDFSHSGFGKIDPETMCTPNLRHLKLLDSRDCEQTFDMFKKLKPKIKVYCGGIAPQIDRPKSEVSDTFPTVFSKLVPSEDSVSNATASTSSETEETASAATIKKPAATTTATTATMTGTTTAKPMTQTPIQRIPVVPSLTEQPDSEYDDSGGSSVSVIVRNTLVIIFFVFIAAIFVLSLIFWRNTKSILQNFGSFLSRKIRFIWYSISERDVPEHVPGGEEMHPLRQ